MIEREDINDDILDSLERRNRNWDKLDEVKNQKVDKVEGKDLSTNDYTDADKEEVSKVKDKADKTYVDDRVMTQVPLDAKFTDTKYEAGENVTIDDDNIISASGGGLGLFQFEVNDDGDLILHYPDGDPEPGFEIVNGELIFTFN